MLSIKLITTGEDSFLVEYELISLVQFTPNAVYSIIVFFSVNSVEYIVEVTSLEGHRCGLQSTVPSHHVTFV